MYNQKHETMTHNPPIRIYVNKIENRITFKIKIGYYLKIVMAETSYLKRFSGSLKKLLGSTKNKITTDENGENLPHLEITEVLLVHCYVAIVILK